MDEILSRDQNHVTVLAGVTNDSDQDITMLRVDPISKRLLISATSSGGGVTDVIATLPITSSGGTTPNISSTLIQNRLLGRGSASGTGVFQAIILGTNLSLSGTTLNATGGGTPGGSNTQVQFNDSGAFGGTDQFTFDKDTGAVAINQATPLAMLHVTPNIALPSSFSTSLSLSATGYSFGSGDKDYSLYAENSTIPVFSTAITAHFTEEPSSDFDPTGASATINYGESGYTADNSSYNYTIWALYGGSTLISFGTIFADAGSDDGSSNPLAVDVSWTAPIGTIPDGYLVQIGGSNANSGQFQVTSGTSFTDSNSGWTSSASYLPIQYNIGLNWVIASVPVDSYVVTNDTNSTYILLGNVNSTADDNTWASGAPTVTPTGQTRTAQFDGSEIAINGVDYLYPSSSPAGYLHSDGNSPSNLVFQNISPNEIIGLTSNELLYGNMQQSANGYFDGTSMKLTADFGTTIVNNTTSSGTVNNFSTAGISSIRFTINGLIVTGFANGFSGKQLFIISPSGQTTTLKNQNTGSTAANRIITPGGLDMVMTPNTTAELIYDDITARWVVVSFLTLGATQNSSVPNSAHTVFISIANPAQITWVSHGLNSVSPVVFTTTGALPAGITAGTVYWTVVLNVNNFVIATSIANAISGTFVVTSGTQSGVHTATSGMPLTSNTSLSITALSLGVGDWDISGSVAFTANALTTATIYTGSIGTTDNSVGTSPNSGAFAQFGISVGAAGQEPTFPVGLTRINLASTTTVYLVANSTFATSTMTAYGFIGARRAR